MIWKQYKAVYFKNGIKGIRKYVPQSRINYAYYWELGQREKIWKDNVLYRQVKESDKEFNLSLNKLKYYIPIITDKNLRKYIQNIIKTCHITYSAVIWFNLGDRIFKSETTPKIVSENAKKKEFAINLFQKY